MIYVLLIELFTALPDIIFAVMLIIMLVGVPLQLYCHRRHIKRFFTRIHNVSIKSE